jgi:transcriptional regulator with XRE-family HTH domain
MARSKAPAKHAPRAAGAAHRSLGERIRVRRVELGMSQETLAIKLGVSFQQVQKYEKGVNRVDAERLNKIAHVLETPIVFFFDNGNAKEREVQSLLSSDPSKSLRLLRAFNSIEDDSVRHHFVSLIESVAPGG